jgi:hypothetical protein
MTGVQAVSKTLRRRRGLVLSLALAVTLAAIPLQRLAAAAHDPSTAGAGMGSRAPIMLETGARLAAPGSAAGSVRMSVAPARVALTAPGPNAALRAAQEREAGVVPTGLLTSYGRLQLEGG